MEKLDEKEKNEKELNVDELDQIAGGREGQSIKCTYCNRYFSNKNSRDEHVKKEHNR